MTTIFIISIIIINNFMFIYIRIYYFYCYDY